MGIDRTDERQPVHSQGLVAPGEGRVPHWPALPCQEILKHAAHHAENEHLGERDRHDGEVLARPEVSVTERDGHDRRTSDEKGNRACGLDDQRSPKLKHAYQDSDACEQCPRGSIARTPFLYTNMQNTPEL